MSTDEGKKGAKKSSAKAKSWGVTWVNYDLTVSDKERLSDKELRSHLAGFDVESLVVEGFKYSCGVDTKNSCYIASLTDKSEGSLFRDHCLTGRGATPAAARISLLFRHLVLAEGDWTFFGSSKITEDDLYF